MRTDIEPAFLLHSRHYRNTSAIVDFFTLSHGRIATVVKGIYGKSKNQQKLRGTLQAFQPLLISWQGGAELKTLLKTELAGPGSLLSGRRLFSALYVNEILMRLLQSGDPHSLLFGLYQQVIDQLSTAEDVEVVLRVFEFSLLREIGYDIVLDQDAEGDLIDPEAHYRYDGEQGFIGCDDVFPIEDPRVFCGRILASLKAQHWHDVETLSSAKRLARLALQPHLGAKPLQSRALFR